jgi:Uma2 family endonuclease
MIGGALRALLREHLRGKPCRAAGPTLKIEVMDRIRYPDAFVYCTRVPAGETVIKEPVVVFEVLSPGTSRTDRIEKLREYQATASIQRYVILEQDSIAATVFARHGSDWDARALTADDVLRMPEIDVEIRLADIYADLQFEADDADGADPGALNSR